MAKLASKPTAVIDAQGTWLRTHPEPAAEAEAGGIFTTLPFGAHVSWLSPRTRRMEAGSALLPLRIFLRQEDSPFGHVIVDLTGLDQLGEHLDAAALLDGVALVARAGRTKAPVLERWMRELPADRNLGVLLIGT
jgi:hypothetical protein